MYSFQEKLFFSSRLFFFTDAASHVMATTENASRILTAAKTLLNVAKVHNGFVVNGKDN